MSKKIENQVKGYIKIVNGTVSYVTVKGVIIDFEVYTATGIEYLTSIPWIYHE